MATPSMSLELRLMLTTGFCGGYTTFSSYSYETAVLLESGAYGRAAIYSLGSVVLALLATFCGFVHRARADRLARIRMSASEA